MPASNPFLNALEWAARNLVVNHGEPRPEENEVFIGPTRVDLTAAGMGTPATKTRISDRERAMMKSWKSQDLSNYYREQRHNRRR